jgi:restriction endonuclease S subunit
LSFIIPKEISSDKLFVIHFSELEDRFEPDYYRPSIRACEDIVRRKSSKKLFDFIENISSGATPSLKEKEKYYSSDKDGVPFLRVQNLNPNGQLDLQNIKYINLETHYGMLKRSQVCQSNLLVKITGVGRMAIASVAQDGFIGNINQHIVVIRTKNRETSEYLANYLNLDIIEKLATRRSTGATRPALDYPSIKSIPIVENIDFSLLEKSLMIKKEKEKESQSLLDSIDDYLYEELGFCAPDLQDKKMIFLTSFSKITGGRIDPNFVSKIDYLMSQNSIYPLSPLKELLSLSPQYGANEKAVEITSPDDIRYIRITDIDDLGELKPDCGKTAANVKDQYLLKFNDILFARSGSVGKCYIHKDTSQDAIFAGYLIKFVINESRAIPDFIFYYCNSSIYRFWVSAIKRSAVQSNINSEEFNSLPIPLPDLPKQKEIVNTISAIRLKSKEILVESELLIETAKREIEKQFLR